jgi:hypothetical protein
MKGLKQVIGDPNHAQEVFTNPTLPLAMPVCATPAIPVRADESTGVVDGLGITEISPMKGWPDIGLIRVLTRSKAGIRKIVFEMVSAPGGPGAGRVHATMMITPLQPQGAPRNGAFATNT